MSRTVARALALNEDLTEAIGLGHDLGHPPFGHVGEAALDGCLRERFETGFRHYEQSLRVVDSLERDGLGLNLTAPVRDGIVSHSGRAAEPATLEGRIVRLVDRVAYINHDIDDAVRAGRTGARQISRRRRSRSSAKPARSGSTDLVHDLVENSAPAGDIVQGEAGRGGDVGAARVHVRARLPGSGGDPRARQDRSGDRPAVLALLLPSGGRSRALSPTASCRCASPTTSPG